MRFKRTDRKKRGGKMERGKYRTSSCVLGWGALDAFDCRFIFCAEEAKPPAGAEPAKAEAPAAAPGRLLRLHRRQNCRRISRRRVRSEEAGVARSDRRAIRRLGDAGGDGKGDVPEQVDDSTISTIASPTICIRSTMCGCWSPASSSCSCRLASCSSRPACAARRTPRTRRP